MSRPTQREIDARAGPMLARAYPDESAHARRQRQQDEIRSEWEARQGTAREGRRAGVPRWRTQAGKECPLPPHCIIDQLPPDAEPEERFTWPVVAVLLVAALCLPLALAAEWWRDRR